RVCRKVGPPDIEGGMQAGAWLGLGLCAASAACGAGEIAAYSGAGFDAPAPPPPDAPTAPQPDAPSGPPQPGPLLGSFQLTYYYVAAEADYANTGVATTLYDPSCAPLATVTDTFADAVVIEGTGALLDGRVFNYAGSCACPFSPCFEFVDADHPWGA